MSRPHLVLIIDRSGSMSQPLESWIACFNEFVDSVRYFSHTPLVSVFLFADRTTQMAYKVPADHMQRFDTTNFVPGGGTSLFGGLCTAVNKCLQDSEITALPTQFLLITDGGFGDSMEATRDKIIADARSKKWGIAMIGPGATAMERINTAIKGVRGDVAITDCTPESIKALGLAGAKALEEWMKKASTGMKPSEKFWGGRNISV